MPAMTFPALIAAALLVTTAKAGYEGHSGPMTRLTSRPKWNPTTEYVDEDGDTPIYLFDLESDPYEVVDHSTNDEYADDLDGLLERFEDFLGDVATPVISPSPLMKIQQAAGGAVPWEDYDDYESLAAIRDEAAESRLETYPLASTDDVPNIIFILLDDYGYNDFGFRSTYLDFATPYLDSIAEGGITLDNYYTGWICSPARAQLMTGRYAIRTGFQRAPLVKTNLPIGESTLGEEMQAAGYRTAIVGKWHLGYSNWTYTPTFRGFDSFYGYLNGMIGYESKETGGLLDLHDGDDLVTDESEIDTHLTFLLQDKMEGMLEDHVENYPDTPLFMYYAMQNIHTGADYDDVGYEAPDDYVEMCSDVGDDNMRKYCALHVMLDEAVANTVCKLDELGMADNTLLVIASDNGGDKLIEGNNYPYAGAKGSMMQGGVKTSAFLHGPASIIPESARGATYTGLVHVTDWMPTLMHVATNGAWEGPLNGYDIDGVNFFSQITDTYGLATGESSRTEIFHNYDDSLGLGAITMGDLKLVVGDITPSTVPADFFSQNADLPEATCDDCSLWPTDGEDEDEDMFLFFLSPGEASKLKESLQEVVGVVAGTGLIVGAALVKRRRQQQQLREGYERIAEAVDNEALGEFDQTA